MRPTIRASCLTDPALASMLRQVAVALVVAVEKPTRLLAVQRIVGRVEVQHDRLARRRGMRIQKRVDEEVLDLRAVGEDLLVAALRIGADRRQLHSVERALARQRLAGVAPANAILAGRVLLADQHRHQRIVSQLVVIVEVLVAQRQAEDSLLDQLLGRVLDQLRIAMVDEALREARQQPRRLLELTQQDRSGVRADRPAVETGHHQTPPEAQKLKAGVDTLCHAGPLPCKWSKLFHKDHLHEEAGWRNTHR